MNRISLFRWQKEALRRWIENKGQGIIESPTLRRSIPLNLYIV